jgi:hypothetical protein
MPPNCARGSRPDALTSDRVGITTRQGYRLATSTGGVLTGRGTFYAALATPSKIKVDSIMGYFWTPIKPGLNGFAVREGRTYACSDCTRSATECFRVKHFHEQLPKRYYYKLGTRHRGWHCRGRG